MFDVPSLSGELKKIADETESSLREIFKRRDIPKELKDAMEYSVFAGGKRLRPALLLLFNEYAGGAREKSLPFASATEMIHTYSLIHDDLPAMDDDNLRRGKPTNHVVFGEAIAILAGDGLLSLAFETMADAAAAGTFGGSQALREIAMGAGTCGMVSGQSMDVACEKTGAVYPVEKIHELKTGALIKAACRAGAALADARFLGRAEEYGKAFGLAFQITDDILDVTGDPSSLGKSVGKDEAEGKNTFVSAYGLEGAIREARLAVDRAKSAAEGDGRAETLLRELAESLIVRDR